ncbi:hypothetical protein R1flu_017394 [Riccia fluitans]|uniref:Uncharacterized protein n=1 Tax=Riccia fluitans TaxID=41844 RepID=A0ABD1ZF89_9MARC
MEKRKDVFPLVILSLTLSFSHSRTLKRPRGHFRVLAARRATIRRAAAPARRALAALQAAIRRASAGRRKAPARPPLLAPGHPVAGLERP